MREVAVAPVAVAEQALVELAGRQPGQLGLEVDRPRALEVRRGARGRTSISSRSSSGPGSTPGIGWTTALTSSPRSSSGTPITAASSTFGWVIEQVLGLLRVDVHAAGDDHVRLAVGEVEVAVLVDVADVADRRALPVGVAALGRLRRVVVVLEVRWRPRTRPCRSRRSAPRCRRRRGCSSVAEDRLADGARVGEPLLGVAEREAVGLGGAVVLDDDRARTSRSSACFTGTGHGAAAWMTTSSDDTS